jgi:hypothetical protein
VFVVVGVVVVVCVDGARACRTGCGWKDVDVDGVEDVDVGERCEWARIRCGWKTWLWM